MGKLYPAMQKIQKMIWVNDDLMLQENLFQLQEALSKFVPKAKTKYPEILAIQGLAFKNDDLMDQDDLFELQLLVQVLTLELARDEDRTDDLVKNFPWLYSESKED